MSNEIQNFLLLYVDDEALPFVSSEHIILST